VEVELVIRDAVERDLPEIVDIYNAAIPGRLATADTEPVTVESRRFQSFYGRPAYHATAEVSVYVAPHHQRHGIGRALLADAVDAAPRLALKTLLGFVFGRALNVT
jgi:L-amino acid N-acyltransferase YncA